MNDPAQPPEADSNSAHPPTASSPKVPPAIGKTSPPVNITVLLNQIREIIDAKFNDVLTKNPPQPALLAPQPKLVKSPTFWLQCVTVLFALLAVVFSVLSYTKRLPIPVVPPSFEEITGLITPIRDNVDKLNSLPAKLVSQNTELKQVVKSVQELDERLRAMNKPPSEIVSKAEIQSIVDDVYNRILKALPAAAPAVTAEASAGKTTPSPLVTSTIPTPGLSKKEMESALKEAFEKELPRLREALKSGPEPMDVLIVALYGPLDLTPLAEVIRIQREQLPKSVRLGLITFSTEKIQSQLAFGDQTSKIDFQKPGLFPDATEEPSLIGRTIVQQLEKSPPRRRVILLASMKCPAPGETTAAWRELADTHVILVQTEKRFQPTDLERLQAWQRFMMKEPNRRTIRFVPYDESSVQQAKWIESNLKGLISSGLEGTP